MQNKFAFAYFILQIYESSQIVCKFFFFILELVILL